MKPQDMSDEELRIRVAELSGWERGPKETFSLGKFGIVPAMSAWHPKSSKDDWQDLPPDFSHDLNAMYGAVKGLSKAQLKVFVAVLRWTDTGYLEPEGYINATVRQRAEAFVIAMTEAPR